MSFPPFLLLVFSLSLCMTFLQKHVGSPSFQSCSSNWSDWCYAEYQCHIHTIPRVSMYSQKQRPIGSIHFVVYVFELLKVICNYQSHNCTYTYTLFFFSHWWYCQLPCLEFIPIAQCDTIHLRDKISLASRLNDVSPHYIGSQDWETYPGV